LRAVERSVALEREHMFVSDIRTAVAQLLADDLTLNEIAHRLGVARATVGYHAQALREAEQGRPSRSRGKGTGPVAAPSVMRG
jgi:DNA-binding transcriptional ArsR family regulator